MRNAILWLSISIFCSSLLGCKVGSGEGLNAQGQPIDESTSLPTTNTSDENKIIFTLEDIQERIFSPICSSCHGGVNPAAGQDLSSIEQTIANLININSSNPLFKRVLPGEPQSSYLYLKITGDPQAGSRMPLGQPSLSDENINAIKEWIQQGALVPDNSATVQVSRIMQHIEPSTMQLKNKINVDIDHKWQEKRKLLITLWFNQAMNFKELTNQQIIITATDINTLTLQNGWLLDTTSISVNIINNHVLQINISNIDSSTKQLNIQLNNSSISTILSLSGQQLDGDLNGVEGGEFSYDIFL